MPDLQTKFTENPVFATLQVYQDNLKDLSDRYDEELQKLLPRGTHVQWRRGSHYQSGEVVAVGYRHRVRVLNGRTGNFVWVEAADLLRAYRELNK